MKIIYMNTKNNESIALYPCSDTCYMKETYSERNAQGDLKNSKRMTLPLNRDGKEFATVKELFEHLLLSGTYQVLAT